MEEKPRGPRAVKRVPVQFGRAKSTAADTVGQTMNLSARGLGLVGDEVFPAGAVLKIVLRPTEETSFELKGIVVWSAQSTGQMGVKLVGTDLRYEDYVAGLLVRKDRPSMPPIRSPISGPHSTPPNPASRPPVSIRQPGASLSPMRSPFQAVYQQAPATQPTVHATGNSVPPTASPVSSAHFPPHASPPPPVRAHGDSLIPMQSPLIAHSNPGGPPSFGSLSKGERSPTGEMMIMGTGERIPTGEMAGLRMARFPEPLPARLGLAEPLDTRGFLVNLSRSGLLVQSGRPFDRGALVRVTITLPDGGNARMEGEVMWSRLPEGDSGDCNVGLRITKANKTFRGLIDEIEKLNVGTLAS